MFSNMPIMLSRFTPGVAPGRGRSAEHLPGVHGRHDERRGRPGRHGQRLRQPQHRQQLHDRRRHEQRLRPPHRQLAQLRPDRGGAHRDVELRRVAGARHGAHRLDDDARRHEHAARLGQLHALEQPVELAQPAAEGRVQAGPAPGRRVAFGPLAHRRLHARRPARHPEGRQRARQGVLLRQLLEVERLGAGAPRRQLHRAGQPEAPRRRFLRPAAVAVGRRGHHAGRPPSVPDLRSADDAARSASSRPRHPRPVPRATSSRRTGS